MRLASALSFWGRNMTPAARIQAAIEILDEIIAGKAAEQALTGWARRSRFAGSKDRHAIRDHVFDVLRNMRSFAALGGADTGRALMLGACRAADLDPGELFSGVGHAPLPLSEEESRQGRDPHSGAEAADIPDWLWPEFKTSLGDHAEAVANALKERAPVHLRVNSVKTGIDAAVAALAKEGISTTRHAACTTALEVTEGARRITQSEAYKTGLVELQDAASQAVVAAIPLKSGMRILDYCAGGGGKSLALATTPGVQVFAHDSAAQRMKDIPERARRAGIKVRCLSTQEVRAKAPFDVVLTDVPCSGSGSWRRSPAGKWALTQDGLDRLASTQRSILSQVADLVAEEGRLVYATCSVLATENNGAIDSFLRANPGWKRDWDKQWTMLDGTDGFYAAHLTRASFVEKQL